MQVLHQSIIKVMFQNSVHSYVAFAIVDVLQAVSHCYSTFYAILQIYNFSTFEHNYKEKQTEIWFQDYFFRDYQAPSDHNDQILKPVIWVELLHPVTGYTLLQTLRCILKPVVYSTCKRYHQL